MYRLAAAAFLMLSPTPENLRAQQPAANAERDREAAKELGAVHWQRDLDAAQQLAERQHKPVFLLFQEIPGCQTCTDFGERVLSHPLLVPAIEQCFVPVVVRNNVEGKEREIRERFREPAWNNPVVRFLDAAGADLLPRVDGVWDSHGIAERMVAALHKAGRPVPGYLQVARDESDPKLERAVFAMHCFWEGEAVLGALDGVVATRSAFAAGGGAEVVEVTFRPSVLRREKLAAHAQAKSCKPVTGGELREAPASDQQHALGGTPYAALELTPMQRTKVHAALTLGTDPKAWLTPAQAARIARAEARK
jgi:hypothetical protein